MPKSRLLRIAPLTLLVLCLLLLWSQQPYIPAYSKVVEQRSTQDRHVDNGRGHMETQEGHFQSRRSVIEPVIHADDDGMEHLKFTHDIAVPVPIKPWTEADMYTMQTSLIGQSIMADLLTAPETMPDFKSLTYQQRVFKALFQYFDPLVGRGDIDLESDPKYKDAWSLYRRLEKTLYPWLRPYYDNAFHLSNATSSSPSRGIVICIGNHQFQYAATTIRAIRQVLKSQLPIQVFYIRDGDLTPTRKLYLETEFDNVHTVAVVDRINDQFTKFGGWALKPYAILASSFQEVILMDADTFFFKKPDTLFDDAGYRKTGALFFYDRTLFANWDVGRNWLASFLPTMSSFVRESRWWRLLSAHEQESGVVVIDKKRALLGLLATCKMNDFRERDQVTYKHMHGDKESFWIGFEMVQTPYSFIKSYGAVIGSLDDQPDGSMVCGNQLHLGVDRQPLWWNGGLLRDKNKWPDLYLSFTHYAEGQDWDFQSSCIKDTNHIRELSFTERALTQAYMAIDAQRKEDEELIQQDRWKPRQQKVLEAANTIKEL
ncbi:hypothetical protein LRAMOSA06221 [Lichtheimia ramosa]|uniref:Alpha-1,3-mannosyltransferase n=1 Tax=Lichtheimia ramosa TaxID=688394 RepID=A0A077X3A7_9FUNG|nr:hypothetical protein LRAMOSA06221 [Lichtheimia ramosa]